MILYPVADKNIQPTKQCVLLYHVSMSVLFKRQVVHICRYILWFPLLHGINWVITTGRRTVLRLEHRAGSQKTRILLSALKQTHFMPLIKSLKGTPLTRLQHVCLKCF